MTSSKRVKQRILGILIEQSGNNTNNSLGSILRACLPTLSQLVFTTALQVGAVTSCLLLVQLTASYLNSLRPICKMSGVTIPIL